MHIDPISKTLESICRNVIKQAVDSQTPAQSLKNSTADLNQVYFSVYTPKTNTLVIEMHNNACDQLESLITPYLLQKYPQAKIMKKEKFLDINFDFTKSFDSMNSSQDPKAKFKEIIKQLSTRISIARSHFCGGPFVLSARAIKSNSTQASITWSHLPGDRIWLITKKQEMIACFGFNFQDQFQAKLAKQMVNQMDQAKKHIPDSPSINVIPGQPIPPLIIQHFPTYKRNPYQKFQAGIFKITLTNRSPILQDQQQLQNLLGGLKGFISYHVRASKMYLHTRVLKRINDLDKSLGFARFDAQQMEYFKAK